jgi:hypothetical protein
MRQLGAEPILALQPSLVLAETDSGPPAVHDQLRSAGVNLVIVPNNHPPAGVLEKIGIVSAAVGKEAEGKALTAKLQGDFAHLEKRNSYSKQPFECHSGDTSPRERQAFHLTGLAAICFEQRETSMFIAMNRFQVRRGQEEAFERVWKTRDTRLTEVPGFVEFHLLRGPEQDEYTLYSRTRSGLREAISRRGPSPMPSARRMPVPAITRTCISTTRISRGSMWCRTSGEGRGFSARGPHGKPAEEYLDRPSAVSSGGHTQEASLVQAFLQNGVADRVLVDDENFQAAVSAYLGGVLQGWRSFVVQCNLPCASRLCNR